MNSTKQSLNKQVSRLLQVPVNRESKCSSYYTFWHNNIVVQIRVSDHSYNPWNNSSYDYFISITEENGIEELKSKLREIFNTNKIERLMLDDDGCEYTQTIYL